VADILFIISVGIILTSIVLAFLRLLKGPHAADRAVALDSMTIISLSLIVASAYLLGRIIYLDVALVYGLISFIGVIAVARFLERGL